MKQIVLKTARGYEVVPVDAELLSDRKIVIENEITHDSACDFLKALLILNKESSTEPIDLFIDSQGGEITAGLLMYDAIKGSRAPVRMFCLGHAYSMAAVIFAAGRNGRYMLDHSEILIHEAVSGDFCGGDLIVLKSMTDRLTESQSIINNILAESTGCSLEEIEKYCREAVPWGPLECIEKGFCDGIVEFNDLIDGTVPDCSISLDDDDISAAVETMEDTHL